MGKKTFAERMQEILELYSECKNEYDNHIRRIKRGKELGRKFTLSQEQACYVEDCIHYSTDDDEFDSIGNVFFVEATLRDQPKIYGDLHEEASKSVQYIYKNIADFHLPDAEKEELLQHTKKTEKLLATAVIMNLNDQFEYEPVTQDQNTDIAAGESPSNPDATSPTVAYPPLTYPIYLARTYPSKEIKPDDVVVYSIGYSPDNLIARFAVASFRDYSHRIDIKENIDDQAYQIAVKALKEFVHSKPERGYPQKLVIGEVGVLDFTMDA